MRRRTGFTSMASLVVALLSCGCTDFGRSRGTPGYTWMPFATPSRLPGLRPLYDEVGFPIHGTGDAIRADATWGLAEVGRDAPSAFLFKAMNGSPTFASIKQGSGGDPMTWAPLAHPPATRRSPNAVRRDVVRQFSKDAARQRALLGAIAGAGHAQGCDYVVAVAYRTSARLGKSYLPWFDLLLIFPLFIVPDQRVDGDGLAVAWILDARTGEILRFETATATSHRLATFMSCPGAVKLAMDTVEPKLAAALARQIAEKR